jgi:hypothetical protein
MKAEIRAGAIFNVGERLDDMLEAAQRDATRFDGKVAGCMEVAESITALLKAVDEDLDSGQIPDLETAALVKKWVSRCFHLSENLARRASNEKMSAAGAVAAMTQAVRLVADMHSREKAQVEQVQELTSQASPEREADEPSERSAPVSLKAQRLAEDAGSSVKSPVRKKRVAKKKRVAS